MNAESQVPEQFQNIAISQDGLDYYSLAYYSYFKLLDRGIVTFHKRIPEERFLTLAAEDGISMSGDDFRNLCSTIAGSKENESLFGVFKEHEGQEYKIDLLRAEKRKLKGQDDEQWCLWIQHGDDIRGFDEDGNYRDEFDIDHTDHVNWAEQNSYGEFMSRVVSEKTLKHIFSCDFKSLKDRDDLMNYVKEERERLLN